MEAVLVSAALDSHAVRILPNLVLVDPVYAGFSEEERQLSSQGTQGIQASNHTTISHFYMEVGVMAFVDLAAFLPRELRFARTVPASFIVLTSGPLTRRVEMYRVYVLLCGSRFFPTKPSLVRESSVAQSYGL